MLLNLFIGGGESFMPLYITIMVAAVGATIQKHTRKVHKIDWPEQSMLLDLHRDEWHEIS
jgi:hypothetical protein